MFLCRCRSLSRIQQSKMLRTRVGRPDGDSGEKLRARFANQSTRFHEVLERDANILVVYIELLFQGVQFRIVVDLPPFAVKGRVLRLRYSPALGLLELRGRLFEGRGAVMVGEHTSDPRCTQPA